MPRSRSRHRRPRSPWPTARRTPAGPWCCAPTRGPTGCCAPLGVDLPLTVTLEQATYFAAGASGRLRAGSVAAVDLDGRAVVLRLPLLRRAAIKAAQDCGGPLVDPDTRGNDARPGDALPLAGHVARLLPGSGRPVRSLRCQYALTPDRDFVLDRVPGHPSLVVGLGCRSRLQVRTDLRAAARRPGPGSGSGLADLRPGPAGVLRPVVRRPLAGVAGRRSPAEKHPRPPGPKPGRSQCASHDVRGVSLARGKSREVVLGG